MSQMPLNPSHYVIDGISGYLDLTRNITTIYDVFMYINKLIYNDNLAGDMCLAWVFWIDISMLMYYKSEIRYIFTETHRQTDEHKEQHDDSCNPSHIYEENVVTILSSCFVNKTTQAETKFFFLCNIENHWHSLEIFQKRFLFSIFCY